MVGPILVVVECLHEGGVEGKALRATWLRR